MTAEHARSVTPAQAIGFGDRPTTRRMRLISFKPLTKGSLRGFANVELPNGLRITDCPVLVSGNGKAWATLPSKPVLDRDGRHAKPDGKPQYAAILEWKTRDLSDGFSTAVIELIRAKHPDALDGGEP